MSSIEPSATPSPTPRRDAFWLFVVGIVMLLGTWFTYEDLTALENGTRETMRLNLVLKILYETFGIMGVIVPMVAMCVGIFVYAVKRLITPAA